jgi:glutathionyl-hydroquinone reductase
MTTAAAVASPADFETYGDYQVKKGPPAADGAFVRPVYRFQGRVSADGSTGYPAEPGRYHLYVSLACPWAHRSVIVRALLGLADVVSMSVVDPVRDGRGWAIDALNERIYATVNNGVYRCGFATSQEAYNSAVASLFATLDDLDQRLATRRYLAGDALTEADVRLWVTLARFDAVYVTHFKANLRRLADYPNLWPYARDLYSIPAFGGTTDFDQIKRHYYGTHPQLNPLRIVPAGPVLDWDAPQQRAALAQADRR